MHKHQEDVDFIVFPNKHGMLASGFAVMAPVAFTEPLTKQLVSELILAKQDTENTTVADGS